MVYKRDNSKYWWYKFTWNGQIINKTTKQNNKRTAETIEAAHRTELARAEILGIKDRTSIPILREFAPQFLEAIATDCADKPGTVCFYKAKTCYLLADATLADSRLDNIDEAVIDAYKQRRTKAISNRKRPYSVVSVNRELATLRRLLRLAQEWKILAGVPRIRLLRGEHEREFVLNYVQEEAYLNAASGNLKDLAMLQLDTGLRMGETLTLAVSDVHLTPAEGARFGFLTVRGRNAKNSKSRNVPLTARVSRMLDGRVTGVEAGLVFHRPDGRRLSQTYLDYQHQVVRERIKLGSEFVCHSFRHTYGTRLGESGADAFTIRKLMGHSSVAVSQRYVHPSPETVENAVSRMENMSERKRAAFVVA